MSKLTKEELKKRLEPIQTQISNANVTLLAMIELLISDKPQVKLDKEQPLEHNTSGVFAIDTIARPINSDDLIVSGINHNGHRQALALSVLSTDKLYEIANILINQL